MKRKTDKKFLKSLGKRIRQIRIKEKMSQSQLGFESGIDRDQIGRIELGKQSTNIDNIKAIADVFDMQLKELLDFEY